MRRRAARSKDIFRQRASERAKGVVEEWKAQKLYPYEGEANTHIERVERQVFDIVAVTVQEASPDFSEISRPQLALHLRLLRNAIEHSPTDLQRILDEVLKLPARKQRELAQLLDETDLSAIINAATLIADRLKFLQGLSVILFEFEAKNRLRERTQLHKILESNTWIFGEEFNLWASDRELTTVLKAHKEKLDQDLVIDEPVKLLTRQHGIVDLMLSRAQKRHRADDYEHLVVELKAPKVKLGPKELTQIKDYALSVSRDPRFHRVGGVRWHFWLVSDEYDDFVAAEIESGPDPQRRLINRGANFSIGIKTWGEILDENNARLQFVKEKLSIEPTKTRPSRSFRRSIESFLKESLLRGNLTKLAKLPPRERLRRQNLLSVFPLIPHERCARSLDSNPAPPYRAMPPVFPQVGAAVAPVPPVRSWASADLAPLRGRVAGHAVEREMA